jgi:hypothetical protein
LCIEGLGVVCDSHGKSFTFFHQAFCEAQRVEIYGRLTYSTQHVGGEDRHDFLQKRRCWRLKTLGSNCNRWRPSCHVVGFQQSWNSQSLGLISMYLQNPDAYPTFMFSKAMHCNPASSTTNHLLCTYTEDDRNHANVSNSNRLQHNVIQIHNIVMWD